MFGKNTQPPLKEEISPRIKDICDRADQLVREASEQKRKQDDFLKELGFKLTFEDVIALLKDEERLKIVVKKLKLKAFW